MTTFHGTTPKVGQEQAEYECKNKALVAYNQTPQVYQGNLAGIAHEIDRREAQRGTFAACMAEKGYKVDWVKK